MASIQRTYLQALLGAILAGAFCGAVQAAPPNTIKEVTVAPDLRRVIVKCSEPVGEFNTFRLDRPPRLVVDIAGARPDRNLKPERAEQNGGLKVQVAESRTGAHLVLDFGGAPLPQLRVRRIGTYLIVFMEDWKPFKQSVSQAKAGRKGPPGLVPGPPKVAAKSFPPKKLRRSDLAIESARVIDGLIVLTVMDRQHPAKLYRIDLGVNFEQMGFVSAGIYPLQAKPGEPLNVTTSAAGQKIGPRKEAQRGIVEKSPGGMMSLSDSRKSGSRPTGAAFGPRRSPQLSPARGPVSLQLRTSPSRGLVKNKLPDQSAVQSAQAKLFSNRQALLARSQAFGLTPHDIRQPGRLASH